MKYTSVPFDINLFFDIIYKNKECYILKEKDRILHFVGYDSYNDKYVFANESDKKSYITIKPIKISENISIFRIIPEIGMCVEFADNSKMIINDSTIQLFMEREDWKPANINIDSQFKKLHNLDIVILSNNECFLYVVGGYFINKNITIHKDNFNKNMFIKYIYAPIEGILPNGFSTIERVMKDSSYTLIYDYQRD